MINDYLIGSFLNRCNIIEMNSRIKSLALPVFKAAILIYLQKKEDVVHKLELKNIMII